jgi:adenylate kinase family enzyme
VGNENCEISQIIGQDSYESALERCRKGEGIYSLHGRQLIVYPRRGYDQTIKIPTELSGCVQIAEGYFEENECSSTLIRECVKKGRSYDQCRDFLCEPVYQYLINQKLYSTLPNNRHIVVIMGSPGSGKGTICDCLVKSHPQYTHISAGDLYRVAQTNKTPEYYVVEKEREKGVQSYMEALTVFIINQLKRIIVPFKYYLIDGLKTSDFLPFEQTVAPIDSVVILNCQYTVAQARLKTRHRPDDTDVNIKKRLDNYYRYLWVQKETLESYADTGRPVINLSSQASPDYIAHHPAWKTLLV